MAECLIVGYRIVPAYTHVRSRSTSRVASALAYMTTRSSTDVKVEGYMMDLYALSPELLGSQVLPTYSPVPLESWRL